MSWVRYLVRSHTLVSPSADSRWAVVSHWRKYVYEELVNHLRVLGQPRKSVVGLTDRPDIAIAVYRGRKTITQQQQQQHKDINACANSTDVFFSLILYYRRTV